jgi:hypothetical protein
MQFAGRRLGLYGDVRNNARSRLALLLDEVTAYIWTL